MLDGLVRAALKQRLIVVVIAIALLAFGLQAARKLSVDAFPDVTNVQVQIATEAPGRSPEEVERFVTVPLEIAMTGLPGLTEMRSLNKPGLSLITLVFTDATDVYFARQLVMERLLEVGASLPQGVDAGAGAGVDRRSARSTSTRSSGPTTASARSAKDELHRAAHGAGLGGAAAAALDPRRGRDQLHRRLRQAVPGAGRPGPPALLRASRSSDVYQALARNNANSGGGVLPQGAEQYLVRGVGLIRDLDDIR